MYRAFNQKFNKICSEPRLQKIHTVFEKSIRCSKPCGVQKSVWTILSGVVAISGSRRSLEAKFQPCWATFWLRKCRSQGYVHNQRGWKHKFEFQKSHQKRCISERKCIAQIALFTHNRALQKVERQQGSKLGNGQKSTLNKRKNQCPYRKIRAHDLSRLCRDISFRFAPLHIPA